MSGFPTQLFVNGNFVAGRGRQLAQIDPATEETFCEVDGASASDLDGAITGAQRAFETTWRDLAPGRRAEVLFKIAQTIRENAEAIAQVESRNVGKPIADARDEVALGA